MLACLWLQASIQRATFVRTPCVSTRGVGRSSSFLSRRECSRSFFRLHRRSTGGAAGGGGIASPEVDQESGHPDYVVDISDSDSDDIGAWESDECHDSDGDSDASSEGELDWGTDTEKKEMLRR